jgi:glycosyltransferase involved in cell wall biosynthesis
MACGLPVVAVAEGGVVETVSSPRVGVLVERTASDFAGAVKQLLQSPEKLQVMSEAARTYVVRSWDWDAAVRVLEQHLTQAAFGNRRPEESDVSDSGLSVVSASRDAPRGSGLR